MPPLSRRFFVESLAQGHFLGRRCTLDSPPPHKRSTETSRLKLSRNSRIRLVFESEPGLCI
jgi:hypothetical protein